MNEQYDENEKEVNIKNLFYFILKHWRSIFVTGCICAVLIGGFVLVKELISQMSEKTMTSRRIKYEAELAEYEDKGRQIDKTLHDLELNIQKQEEYNDKSFLMDMNPLSVWRGSVSLYIETDYQIMPDKIYQNVNPAARIAQVYARFVSSGEFYQYVLDNWETEEEIEMKYLREVLTASVDDANYVVSVSAFTASSDENNVLLTLAREAIQAKKTEIGDSLGEFNLSVTNTALREDIDLDLQETQRNNTLAVEDWQRTSSVTEGEKLEWERDRFKIKEPVLTPFGAVKKGIKTAIIAAVAAAFLLAICYASGFLFSGKVSGTDDLPANLTFLGEMPNKNMKKKFWKIDAWLSRRFSPVIIENRLPNYLDALAVTINQLVAEKKAESGLTSSKVVLVGDASERWFRILQEYFDNKKNLSYQIELAGNTYSDGEAAKKVADNDMFILVTEQYYSKRVVVNRIVGQVVSYGKSFLGSLLVGADATIVAEKTK